MSQGDQGRVEVCDDPIDALVVGDGPALAEGNIPHLTVDKGHGGRRGAPREPCNHLRECGWQAVWMAPVTAAATSQPGEALASVLGEPPLHRPERNAMMTRHVGQRHMVFHAGLEYPIAF